MKMRAQLIVQLTTDYIMANGEDEAQNSGLSRMAGVASMMTEVNFLICDETDRPCSPPMTPWPAGASACRGR